MGLIRRAFWRLKDRFFRPAWVDVYDALESVWLAQAIHIAAALGIADLLHDAPLTAEQLAHQTEADERSLYRVLRTLSAFDIFRADAKGRFHNTARSDALRSKVPFSLRDWAITLGGTWWPLANHALEAVRAGQSAPRVVGRETLWNIYRDNPTEHEHFIAAMDGFTQWQSGVVVSAFDFSRFRHAIDVGGGRGTLMIQLLSAYPHLRGTIYDMPETISIARQNIEAAELQDRCETLAGSFLEGVPRGGDIYLIKHVLHDWPDQEALSILTHCAQAMDRNSTLVLAHALLAPESSHDRITKLTDINYMITLGGGMRTLDEFTDLLRRAGLRRVAVHPTRCGDISLLEARLADT